MRRRYAVMLLRHVHQLSDPVSAQLESSVRIEELALWADTRHPVDKVLDVIECAQMLICDERVQEAHARLDAAGLAWMFDDLTLYRNGCVVAEVLPPT